MQGSNLRPTVCKTGALPAELIALVLCSRTVIVPNRSKNQANTSFQMVDTLGVNDSTSQNASNFSGSTRECIANGNATNSTFPYRDRTALRMKIAASQFSSKSLEDQQHERRFMARDLAEWEAGR